MLADLRLALRQLVRSPGFTVVAVLTLALGVGLNTSMFSIMNVLLLRPLPYPAGDRLVRVFVTTPKARNWAMTAPGCREFRAAVVDAGLERVGVFGWWGANLTEPGGPAELLVSLRASADFLPALGVQPLLGRWFTEAEDFPGSPAILISHALWQRVYAGDPQILGRAIAIDGELAVVVGVMPPRVAAPAVFGMIDFWRPLRLTADEEAEPKYRWLHAVARLAEGVSLAQANTAVGAIAARIARDHPQDNEDTSLRVVPLHASGTDDTARTIAWLTLALAGFVLLIACANLANLQLARATGRIREVAVRAALGASRVRLLRPMMCECFILAMLGGGAGLFVATICNQWIGRQIVFTNAPMGHDLPLDGRVLLFTALVSLGAGLGFGCVPGWWAARVPVLTVLKDNSRGTTSGRATQRLRRILVVGEFALALMLLTGAGLILGGLDRFLHRDTGWRTDGLVYGYVATQAPKYRDSAVTVEFYQRMCDRLATLPGVDGVAFGWDLPIAPDHEPRPFHVEGRPVASSGQAPLAFVTGVMQGYFAGLDIAPVQGRDFTRRDGPAAPRVAVVSESLARVFWPGESAVGKRLASPDLAVSGWWEIVGVVGDARFAGHLSAPATRFQIYVPFAQEVWNWGAVALRTRATPETLIEPMRRAIAELDPDVPLYEPRAVREEVARRLANSRLAGQLLGGVAVLGLFLAALGIHGVMAQTVAQRTAEIGVRMALGADGSAVYRLVFGDGFRLAAVGTALGTLGALLLDQTLPQLVPEIPAANPVWLALTAAMLLAVALIAIWLPARRAVRIDPIIALRGE